MYADPVEVNESEDGVRTIGPDTGVAVGTSDGEGVGPGGVAVGTGVEVGTGEAVVIGVAVGALVGVLTGVGLAVGWTGVGVVGGAVVGGAVIGELLGDPPPPPWPAATATIAPTATIPPTIASPAPPPAPPPPLAPALGALEDVSGGLRSQCADAIDPGSGKGASAGPKEGGGTLTSCVPIGVPDEVKNVKRTSTADARGGGCMVTSGVTVLASGSIRSEHDAIASVLSTTPMIVTGAAANVGGACMDATRSAMPATYVNVRRRGMVANIVRRSLSCREEKSAVTPSLIAC